METFNINGKKYELDIDPHMTLLELLRDRIGLIGTKLSCGVGECGACTVIVDGKAILSCCTLAMIARGKEILTIEGLAQDGDLNPVQQAFAEKGAIQCGFCTPGMVMMATSILDENPKPGRNEISEALAGNLCRCTGYVKIIDSVLQAVTKMQKENH